MTHSYKLVLWRSEADSSSLSKAGSHELKTECQQTHSNTWIKFLWTGLDWIILFSKEWTSTFLFISYLGLKTWKHENVIIFYYIYAEIETIDNFFKVQKP